MKKIFLLFAIGLIGLSACKKSNFLDDKSNGLDANAVFTDSARTIAFLNRMYEDIGFNFNKQRWESVGSTEQATDDSEFSLSNTARRSVALGGGFYSADNMVFGDAYSDPWVNIRRANLLLQKLPSTPLSPVLQKRVAAEARFMRAYFYQYMIENFGGMPLIGDAVFGTEDVINFPRNTFEECVSYVVKEYDTCTLLLPPPNRPSPEGYEDRDYGRVTKGACMGMKARLLLYAASPLFNGGAIPAANDNQKKVVSYPTYSVSRWQAAADAANAVINSNYYSLNVDNTTAPGYGFYKLFLKRVNSEYILFVNRPPNRDIEAAFNPPSRGGGRNTTPTQNLVDCFPMVNGKAITDPTSGYNPASPYVDRDPRFDNTVIYNGSMYYLPSGNGRKPVLTYVNAPGGDSYGNTPTGYYARKMCDIDVSNNSSFTTERGWPLLRYAEILLSYAEAINETGQTQLAYPKLIELRNRAGITAGADGLYGLKPNMTVAEMREIIRNERHIELAFEADNRWDDLRRWKIAEVIQNSTNKAMKITLNSNGTYTYTVELSQRTNARHNFRPEMYLFPIPTPEIRKAPAMIQNPGW